VSAAGLRAEVWGWRPRRGELRPPPRRADIPRGEQGMELLQEAGAGIRPVHEHRGLQDERSAFVCGQREEGE